MRTLRNSLYRSRGPLTGRPSVPAFASLVTLLLASAVAATTARADVLFEDSFESGAAPWNFVDATNSYTTQGCRTGQCGVVNVKGNVDQQSVFWAKRISNTDTLYISAWWRFPVGYSWDRAAGSGSSLDHKAIIVETTNKHNRIFVNFRGTGSPVISTLVEGTQATAWSNSSAHMVADGKWHHVEFEVQRRTGGGHVRLWFDGAKVLDIDKIVCSGQCPELFSVKVGAYVNQGAKQNQQFFMDDVRIAHRRSDTGVVDSDPAPLPPPPPPVSNASCLDIDSNRLFCDGFESQSLANYDDVRSNGVFEFTNTPLVSGKWALRARVASETLGDNWASAFVGDHPKRRGGPGDPEEDVVLHSQIRFAPDFSFTGGKLFILSAFEDWNAGYPQPNSWSPYYVILQLIPGSGETPRELEGLLHSKTTGTSVWRRLRQNRGSTVLFQRDRWYSIAARSRLNTPGQSDGVFELYIDGELKAQYTDVNFRDSYTQNAWNHLIVSPLQTSSASSERVQYYDEVVLSRYAPGSGQPQLPAAPEPPVLLEAVPAEP